MRLSTLSVLDAGKSSPMGHSILKSQANLANKIGALLIHVYGDAKKLTLNAHTYPMRVVTRMIANNFSFESFTKNYGANVNFDFQCMMPSSHKALLQCIVESFQDKFSAYIKSYALSMALRCDGSVDRSQIIDKIYILLKIITKKRRARTIFFGSRSSVQARNFRRHRISMPKERWSIEMVDEIYFNKYLINRYRWSKYKYWN